MTTVNAHNEINKEENTVFGSSKNQLGKPGAKDTPANERSKSPLQFNHTANKLIEVSLAERAATRAPLGRR